MNLLVDTHIILWWLEDSPFLSSTARAALSDPGNICMVSSVSVWEIAIKRSIGKLKIANNYLDELDQEGFRELAVRWRHADATRDLPQIHRDPFDRILVAQALVDNLTLVTVDENIQKYDVPVLS